MPLLKQPANLHLRRLTLPEACHFLLAHYLMLLEQQQNFYPELDYGRPS